MEQQAQLVHRVLLVQQVHRVLKVLLVQLERPLQYLVLQVLLELHVL